MGTMEMNSSNKSGASVDVSLLNFTLTHSGNLKFEENISGGDESMYLFSVNSFSIPKPLFSMFTGTFISEIFADIDKANTEQKYDGKVVQQEQFNALLSFYSKSNVSLKNLEHVAKLINETPGANHEIPASHYMLTKSIRAGSPVVYYFECSTCNKFTPQNVDSSKSEISCIGCKKKFDKNESNYFAFIPFKKYLEAVISQNVDQIVKYSKECKDSEDLIDIQCGAIYKKISAMYPDSTVLSLLLNTDGVKVFNSSTKQLWPIQLYLNFLPPSMRLAPENILVVGLYFGDKKPDISAFLLPFVKECRQIYDINGFNIKYEETEINFLPMVTHCSCDLPAKAMIQEFISHIGFNACGYCKHPGVSVKNVSKKKSSKTVRYIRKANIPLRNHKDTFLTMIRKSKSSQEGPIDGIKGLSCMVGFMNFDLVDGFPIDYMHCALLGTMKKLLQLWLDSSYFQKDFHIDKNGAAILNQRIMSIKPTSNITRKPRSLDNRREFKANEYRSLLLYYLRYCLSGILSMKYVHNFQLFSAAIYMLLKNNVTYEDVARAETKLNNFVDEFETLYGMDAVSMNLHLLRHIPNAVRNSGPLWTHSLFGFESNNGVLAKSVNGRNRIIEEMANKHILKRTLKLRKNENSSIELDHCSFIGKGRKKKLSASEQFVFDNHGVMPEDKNICIWESVHWRGQLFTSTNYREVKSINYFVCLSDSSLGTVQYYFKHDNNFYALFEKFEVLFQTDHLLEVKSTSLLSIRKIETIVDKLLFMRINMRNIVTCVPNKYERT